MHHYCGYFAAQRRTFWWEIRAIFSCAHWKKHPWIQFASIMHSCRAQRGWKGRCWLAMNNVKAKQPIIDPTKLFIVIDAYYSWYYRLWAMHWVDYKESSRANITHSTRWLTKSKSSSLRWFHLDPPYTNTMTLFFYCRITSSLISQFLPSYLPLVWLETGLMLVESGTTTRRISLSGWMRRITLVSSVCRREATCRRCSLDSAPDSSKLRDWSRRRAMSSCGTAILATSSPVPLTLGLDWEPECMLKYPTSVR